MCEGSGGVSSACGLCGSSNLALADAFNSELLAQMQLSLRSSRWGIAPPGPRSSYSSCHRRSCSRSLCSVWITPLVTTHVTSALTHLSSCGDPLSHWGHSNIHFCFVHLLSHPCGFSSLASILWVGHLGRVTASLSLQFLLNSPDAVQSWNVM